MKPSNSEQLASRLADLRSNLSDSRARQRALTDSRDAAARNGLDALRLHRAKLIEVNDDCEHYEAQVKALEAEHAAAVSAEREAAAKEAYASAKSTREAVVARVLRQREKIVETLRELRMTVRDAEDLIRGVNQNLPAGAPRLSPVEYDLRRGPMLRGPDHSEFWFDGSEPAPRPVFSSKPTITFEPPSSERKGWAARFQVFTLDHLRTPADASDAPPAPRAERTLYRPAHLA